MGMKLGLLHYGTNIDRVFKNRVLGRIFEPKMREVVGGSKRLHNENIHNLYASPNVIRVNK
jgi:hypothetical protein